MKRTISFSALAAAVLAAVPHVALAVTASDPGTSPNGDALEPYLITWLLPVSGIICAIVMVFVDRRIRARSL